MAGLSLYDMDDAEFLARVRDTENEAGWVTTVDLAVALGYEPDDLMSVVVRLNWMKRYGVIERDTQRRKPDGETNENYANWRLTELGNAAVDARFNKRQSDALQSANENQLWLVSQFLADRVQTADSVQATLARRQLQVGFRRRP